MHQTRQCHKLNVSFQMAQSVVTGLPLTAKFGNKTPLSEFQLQRLPQDLIHIDTNDGVGFSFSIPTRVLFLWKCMQS